MCTPEVHISEFGSDVHDIVHINADEDQECTPHVHTSLIQEGNSKENSLIPEPLGDIACLSQESNITCDKETSLIGEGDMATPNQLSASTLSLQSANSNPNSHMCRFKDTAKGADSRERRHF